MKIIKPTYQIIPQDPGLDGIWKQINLGKICYASDKFPTNPDGSINYLAFVDRMKKSSHDAVLEQGTVYLKVPVNWYNDSREEIVKFYQKNKFSKVFIASKPSGYPEIAWITTNYRVIHENSREEDLKFLSNPETNHEKRVTVRFTTQIAVTREFNRHRVNSPLEQSTRYCNYGQEKFESQISISKPSWYNMEEIESRRKNFYDYIELIHSGKDSEFSAIDYWLFSNLTSEWAYLNLLRLGQKPEQARVVLALDTKSELIHTAFVSDWKHFFDLRALDKTGKAHPDAKELALPLMNEFISLGFLNENDLQNM